MLTSRLHDDSAGVRAVASDPEPDDESLPAAAAAAAAAAAEDPFRLLRPSEMKKVSYV
jgi:hypothetical protein